MAPTSQTQGQEGATISQKKRINSLNLEPISPKADDTTRNNRLLGRLREELGGGKGPAHGLKPDSDSNEFEKQQAKVKVKQEFMDDLRKIEKRQAKQQGKKAAGGRSMNPNAQEFTPAASSSTSCAAATAIPSAAAGAKPAGSQPSAPRFLVKSEGGFLKKSLNEIFEPFCKQATAASPEQQESAWPSAIGQSCRDYLGKPDPTKQVGLLARLQALQLHSAGASLAAAQPQQPSQQQMPQQQQQQPQQQQSWRQQQPTSQQQNLQAAPQQSDPSVGNIGPMGNNQQGNMMGGQGYPMCAPGPMQMCSAYNMQGGLSGLQGPQNPGGAGQQMSGMLQQQPPQNPQQGGPQQGQGQLGQMMFNQGMMMGMQGMPGQQPGGGQTMLPVGMVAAGAAPGGIGGGGGQNAQMMPFTHNGPGDQPMMPVMMPVMVPVTMGQGLVAGGQGVVPNQQGGMTGQQGHMMQTPMYHQPSTGTG